MSSYFILFRNFLSASLLLVLMLSCHGGPKDIEPISLEHPGEDANPWIIRDPSISAQTGRGPSFGSDLHRVEILETLPTQRYVYLKVKENEQRYWIATRKMEVQIGEVFFFRNALLKTNFESKEHKKVFDEIYLVSNLVSEDHSRHVSDMSAPSPKISETAIPQRSTIAAEEKTITVSHKGITRIADLVRDPKAYEGHTIMLQGTCSKINPNIMERNWIHLKDGSQDNFDLVITSNTFVPEGKEIKVKGTVALNQDYGAGYTYSLILENGMIIE